jgi:hypothetical protein
MSEPTAPASRDLCLLLFTPRRVGRNGTTPALASRRLAGRFSLPDDGLFVRLQRLLVQLFASQRRRSDHKHISALLICRSGSSPAASCFSVCALEVSIGGERRKKKTACHIPFFGDSRSWFGAGYTDDREKEESR